MRLAAGSRGAPVKGDAMHANDPDLIAQLKASPSLAPPKPLDRTFFTNAQLIDPHTTSDMQFVENMNEIIDQDINRPNQAAYDHWEWSLRMWNEAGRKGPLPHLPAVRGHAAYLTLDLKKAAIWWGFENDPSTRPANWDESDHSAFVVDSLAFVPAYPVIDAAPVPAPIDFTASPIGPSAGPGIFFGTPMSLLAYPDLYPFPSTLSPTGKLIHHVYQWIDGNLHDYWLAG